MGVVISLLTLVCVCDELLLVYSSFFNFVASGDETAMMGREVSWCPLQI